MRKLKDLVGAGGGSGGPKNDKDSLFNTDVFEMLLGLAEGPIGGLDGDTATEKLQNLFIDETPVSNGNGEPSFAESEFVIRYERGNTLTRLQDAVTGQSPVQYLLGSAAAFHNVGVLLAGGTPVTRQTPASANGTFDKLELRFSVQRLVHYSDDGAKQTSVDLEVLYREVGTSDWQPFVEADPITTISGKQTVGGYNKAYSRFVNKTNTGYEFKVTLLGDGSNDDYGRDIVWAGIETSLTNFGPGATTPVGHTLVKGSAHTRTLPATAPGTTSRVSLRFDVHQLRLHNTYGPPNPVTADLRVRYRPVGVPSWTSFISNSTDGLVTIRKNPYLPHLNNINLTFDRDLPAVSGGYEFEVTLMGGQGDGNAQLAREIRWVEMHTKLVGDSTGSVMASEYHPGLAMLQLTAAIKDQFDRVPNISGVWKGLLCHLPTNYNPVTRSYNESSPWAGTFKTTPEWTDNPFWIAYELIVNPRIGMVRANPRVSVNRYKFYELAKHADQLLPDGKGGQKPRYTFNALITDPMDGIELINHIVGTAHAYAYEDGLGNIVLAADRNTPAVATVTREMCVESMPGVCFEYTFTDITERPNEFVTSYVDPDMGWEVQFLGPLVDADSVERNGYNRYEYQSVGCIYPQEAWRKLYFQAITASTEVTTVSFEVSVYGILFELFDIINICDPDMDWGVSGRARSISGTTVMLRDAIYFESAGSYDFSVITNDGVVTRSVSVVTPGLKTQLTLNSPITEDFGSHPSFTIGKVGDPIGMPKPFRIVQIGEVEGDPSRRRIVAVEVNRLKYESADKLSLTDIPGYSWAKKPTSQAPTNLRVVKENRWATADGGYRTDLLLAWDYEAARTLGVRFEVYKTTNGGGYELVATTPQKGVELTGLPFGSYEFKVVAVYQEQRQATTLYWNIAQINCQRLREAGSNTTFTVGGGWLGEDLQLEPTLLLRYEPSGANANYQVLNLLTSGDVAGIEYKVLRLRPGGGPAVYDVLHTELSRELRWVYPAGLNRLHNNSTLRGDLVIQCLVKDHSGDVYPKVYDPSNNLVPAPLTVAFTPDGVPEVTDFELAAISPWTIRVAAQFDEPPGNATVAWYLGSAANGSDRAFVGRGQPFSLNGLKPETSYYLWAQPVGSFGTGSFYPAGNGYLFETPKTTDVDLGVDLEKTVYVYKRAIVGPSAPSSSDGTFESPVPTGWTQAIPEGADPVWVTSRVYRMSGGHGVWQEPYPLGGETMQVQYSLNGTVWVDTFSTGMIYMRVRIGAGNWSSAIRIVGEDGAAGADGSYVDYIFMRSASQPALPSGASPVGWSGQPPAGTLPVWFSTARKNADGSLVTTWSTPTRLTGDQGPPGEPGTPGVDAPAKYTWVVFADTNDGTSTLYNTNTGNRVWQGVAHNQTSVQPASLANSEYSRFTWYRIKANINDVFTPAQLADFNSLAQGLHPDTGLPLLDKRVAAFEGLFNELSALTANLGTVTSGTFQTAAAGSGKVRAVMSSTDVPLQIYDSSGLQLFGVAVTPAGARLFLRGDLAPNSIDTTAFMTSDAIAELRDRLGFMASSGGSGGSLTLGAAANRYFLTGDTEQLPGSLFSNAGTITIKLGANLYFVGISGSITVSVVAEYRTSTDNATWGSWTAIGSAKSMVALQPYLGSSLASWAGTLSWTLAGVVNRYFQIRYRVTSGSFLANSINNGSTRESFTAEQPQSEGILPSHVHTFAQVSGLETALAEKAPISHVHAFSSLTGTPATATRWPQWNEVSGSTLQTLPGAGASGVYGSLSVSGNKAGFSGLHFPDSGHYFMFRMVNSNPRFGIHDGTAWLVAWDENGALNTGTVGWSRLTSVPGTATRWPTFAEVTAKPTSLAGYGITDATATRWPTFAEVTSKPTTVSGYGITDATATRWPTFAEVTSRPTTLAGYGITDAAALAGAVFTGTVTAPNLNATMEIQFNGKQAIGGTNDTWLRLNPSNAFTNGIYCGSSVVRTDGSLQIGANGASFLADGNGAFTPGRMRANGGSSSSWGTNGNGAFAHVRANDSHAHWLITSNVADDDIRSGIQVLNSDGGSMRFYTNKRAAFVEAVNGGLTLSGSYLNGNAGLELHAGGTLIFEARNSNKLPYAKSHMSGAMSPVMTWADFRPNMAPPAGLENTITTNWLAAGAVTANIIAANSINASHLTVTDYTNLITNGIGATTDGWTGNISTVVSNVLGTGRVFTIWGRDRSFGNQFPVTAGDQFYCSFMSVPVGGGVGNYSVSLGLQFFNSSGATINWLGGASRAAGLSGVQSSGGVVTAPGGAVSARIWLHISTVDNSTANGDSFHVSRLEMYRRNNGNLIVDGTITANKIAAGTITGDKIAVGTITATQIAAGTITGDRINVGTLDVALANWGGDVSIRSNQVIDGAARNFSVSITPSAPDRGGIYARCGSNGGLSTPAAYFEGQVSVFAGANQMLDVYSFASETPPIRARVRGGIGSLTAARSNMTAIRCEGDLELFFGLKQYNPMGSSMGGGNLVLAQLGTTVARKVGSEQRSLLWETVVDFSTGESSGNTYFAPLSSGPWEYMVVIRLGSNSEIYTYNIAIDSRYSQTVFRSAAAGGVRYNKSTDEFICQNSSDRFKAIYRRYLG